MKNNAERVQRGSRFSQLTGEQKNELVERARDLARSGGSRSEIARTLAERTGRSLETVRAALRQHDEEHPQEAIFPGEGGPLTDAQKENIFAAYRRGTPVEALCRDYNRTKTTIYRVVSTMRAQRIAELPLDYIDNPRFHRKGADAACLGPMPENDGPTRKPRRPSGLPPYLRASTRCPCSPASRSSTCSATTTT